jgi:ABC-type sugar transport system permease subunit
MLFILYAVPLEIVLALALALLINRKLRLEGLYQTLFFLPYILPMVPAGIMWKWIYAPGSFGLANYALESLGLPRVGWLTDPNIALFAVVIMHVWKNLGFFVVIFLVGLKAISPEVVEAARVDGASEWQTIRHVHLPLLRPTILFGVVMGTIWSMSVFTEVYIMTQGTDVSAGTEMEVLVTTIYKEAFQYFNMGYASTVSLVLFAVSMLFVAIQFRLLEVKE